MLLILYRSIDYSMLKFREIQKIKVHNYKELKKDHNMWNKVNIYKFSKKKRRR